jgi:hypothetical protein
LSRDQSERSDSSKSDPTHDDPCNITKTQSNQYRQTK